MVLYMIVTADKYELPLMVEEYPSVLARKLGIRTNLIHSSIAKGLSGGNKGYKFVKVIVED